MINTQNNAIFSRKTNPLDFNPARSSVPIDDVKNPTQTSFTRPIEQIKASDRFSNELADDKLKAELQGRPLRNVFTSQPLSRLPKQVQDFDPQTATNVITSFRQAETLANDFNSSPIRNSVSTSEILETTSTNFKPEVQDKPQQPIVEDSPPSRLETLNESLQQQAERKVERRVVRDTDQREQVRSESNQKVVQNFLQNEAKRIERAQASLPSSNVDTPPQDADAEVAITTNTSEVRRERTIDIDDRRVRQTGTRRRQRPEVNQVDFKPENANRELNDEQNAQRIRNQGQRTSVQNFQADRIKSRKLRNIGPQKLNSETGLRDVNRLKLRLKATRSEEQSRQQIQERIQQEVNQPKKLEQQEQQVQAERSELREQVDAFAGAQAVFAVAEPREPRGEQEASAVFSRLNVVNTGQRRPISAPADVRETNNDEANRESRQLEADT